MQDVVCRPVSPARHVEDTQAYARRTCGQVVACTTAVGEEVRLPPRLSHFSTVSIDSHGWQAAATFLPATGVLDTSKAPTGLPRRPAVTQLLTVTCCVDVCVLCVKGRNRTVINIYRVNPSSPARSHRPPTRLTSTRALLYLHMMVLGVSAPKTARSCDSCHTHSAHAKPHITADGAHHRAPLCAPTAPHSVVRHAPPPSWSAFSHP